MAASRDRLAGAIAAVLLALGCALPVLMVRFPPMQDLPWHLVLSEIIARPEKFGDLFEARLGPTPYAGFYLIMSAVGSWLTPVLAGKAIVAVTMAALPLSVLFFIASIEERPGWIRFAAFPLGFSQIYYLGFVGYLLALAIYFFGLGAFMRLLLGRGPRAAAAFGTLAAGPLLYLAHPVALALFAVSATLLAIWRTRALRESRFALLVTLLGAILVPALGLALVMRGMESPSGGSPQFAGPVFTARFFIDIFTGLYTTPWNLATTIGYASMGAGAFLALRRARREEPDREGGVRDDGSRSARGPLTILIVLALLMFVLPFRLGNAAHYLNVRLAPLVALWLVVAIALATSRRGGPASGAPVLAGAVLVLACAWVAHFRFDREARAAEPIFSAMRPGARVLPLCFERHSRVFAPRHWNELYLHFQDYYHIEKGGLDPYMLSNPLFPVLYRGDLLDAPGEYRAERFRWARHGGSFDYFLIRGVVKGAAKDEIETHTRPVASSPPWLVTEPIR